MEVSTRLREQGSASDIRVTLGLTDLSNQPNLILSIEVAH
jgi:hypothetical protein